MSRQEKFFIFIDIRLRMIYSLNENAKTVRSLEEGGI